MTDAESFIAESRHAMNPNWFSQQVLAWFDQHGRHDLPWQRDRTPYRVWVAEIMLQQTQVATVIPYYERFIARFPTVSELAGATLDDVLALWSGLGYYARARHLHQAAQSVRDQHGGIWPAEVEVLRRLPGIGRSTAGAIVAQAFNQRQPILDGNVKRVLTRFEGLEGWPGTTAMQAALWVQAERYTPTARVADYTQAMMDLGALVCTRKRPRCEHCPLVTHCRAYAEQRQESLPTPRPTKTLPVRQTQMLLLQTAADTVLLEHRPPTGIWGGLWSAPECSSDADVTHWCNDHLGLQVVTQQRWSVIRHTFSHFHLDITPVQAHVKPLTGRVMEGERWVWYNIRHPAAFGLAAPIQRLLGLLSELTAMNPLGDCDDTID